MSGNTSDMVEISLNGNEPDNSKVVYERQDSVPPPSQSIPLNVTRVKPKPQTVKPLKPIENFDLKMLPFILKHLEIPDLLKFQTVCWSVHRLCSALIYERVCFSQLSGKKLDIFMHTLQNSIISRQGRGLTSIDYAALVRHLTVNNIVFEEYSSLQSWESVRDVINLVADSLVSLTLTIGDESFVDLSPDFIYLHTDITLPKLKHLCLQSKCMRVPSKLVLELLRASPIGGLQSIRLYRCMSNFDASGWFLVSERGGESLQDLVLNPSVGPNMLAWDEKLFNQGIVNISKTCVSLARLDLSGHAISIPNDALENLCASRKIKEIYLPCTMNDAHLLTIMGKPVWPDIKCIGFSCLCVDGEMREKQKNGMSCNRFTDHVLLEFLEFMMTSTSSAVSIHLPVYLIALKTGKRVETLHWLSCSMHITKREKDFFWFQDKLILSVSTNRLARFF